MSAPASCLAGALLSMLWLAVSASGGWIQGAPALRLEIAQQALLLLSAALCAAGASRFRPSALKVRSVAVGLGTLSILGLGAVFTELGWLAHPPSEAVAAPIQRVLGVPLAAGMLALFTAHALIAAQLFSTLACSRATRGLQ